MSATIDFVPFAIGVGANVLPQASYLTLPALGAGFTSGTAVSEELNKVWRQSSFMAAVLAQYMSVQNGNANILDDGDVSGKLALLTSAISSVASGAAVAVRGNVTGLTAQVTSSTLMSLNFTECIVENVGGQYQVLRAGSLGIDASTVGANGLDAGALVASTWYYHYVIYNPTGPTTAALLSTNSTAPTLPSGYTYWARMGAVRTDASSHLMGTIQKGRKVQYVVGGPNVSQLPVMKNGVSGSISAPTYTAVAVAGFVPPTANSISLGIFGKPTTRLLVAPNNSYGANNTALVPPLYMFNGSDGDGRFNMGNYVLEGSNLYYASDNSSAVLVCVGWEE